MTPGNLLIILSDEHSPDVLGCAGHPDVLTPNLDSLARRGTRFANAVCASPICVPARAALATGRNVFEVGYWDNVDAYDGKAPSWHHLLRAGDHDVVSIGKLHYRGHAGDDYGFSSSLLPMHIHEGRGELKMLLRTVPVSDGSQFLASARPGQSSYNKYDHDIVASAEEWLQDRSRLHSEKPWVLMVSLVAPHFPLTVPAEYFDLYAGKSLRLPKDYHFGVNRDAHPYVGEYGSTVPYNMHFRDDADVRRALAGYYGLVSYLDAHVGRLLATLEETGLAGNTRVLYTSDHGDNTGARGLWGKSTMYRESVGVPLITSGPGVAAGILEQAAVSHIDLYKSVLHAVGYQGNDSTASDRSESIFGPLQDDRVVLSEYHCVGARSGVFMVQDAAFKYVRYSEPGMPEELFDLVKDREERFNLALSGSDEDLVKIWRTRLESFLDPVEVDGKAKARQEFLISCFGGRDAILAGKGIGGFSPAP